jgi:hypothetical protein
MKTLCAAAVLGAILLGIDVDAGLAELATISFPDTAVGSTSTVKCPVTSGLCFSSPGDPACSASGTVQSVSGPDGPFTISKFNLLTLSQFGAGACEANPVAFPVSVGANQVLVFQATFAPTATGTFNSSATFSTPAGSATFNFTGKGVNANPVSKGKGFVDLRLSSDRVVPGGFLSIDYETRKGTLQGNADVYLVIAFPSGPIFFVTDHGTLAETVQPFLRNVAIGDATQSLFAGPVPVDVPFGTYTFYLALVYAGVTPNPANLAPSLAGPVSNATLAYTPLSAAQESLIASRGKPDFLTAFWFDLAQEKRESWLYVSGPQNQVTFVNGSLESQETVSDLTGGPGPKVDPGLFTPQTTLAQLTAAFGPPASVTPVDGAPEVQQITYGFGLTVLLRNGRFSSAVTGLP